MRRLRVSLLLAGVVLVVSVSSSHSQYFPQHRWSHRAGDTGTDAANAVAVDLGGRPIVVGSFEGTIDLGGGLLASAGSSDVFVVRYDSDGNPLWSKRLGGSAADVAHGVTVQQISLGGGNWTWEFTITGSFENTVNFGGDDLVSAGGSDGFVVRLDTNGNHMWSSRFGDIGNDVGRAVELTASHIATITGAFADRQLGTTDVFLARYDNTGAQTWAHSYGGPLDDVGRSISGGIITGEFRDTASFGGAPLVSAGGSDIFVAAYDGAGTHLWSKQFGGTQDDAGLSIFSWTQPSPGSSFCTGYFRSTVNFGGGNLVSVGGEDIFLLKLDPNGVHQYSRRYGGPGNDAGTGVTLSSSNGDIELAGRFENTVNFGLNKLTSAGGSDGFLSLFTDTGTNRRNVRMGGSGNEVINGISDFHYLYISSGFDVAVAGAFRNTIDLGGGPLVSAGGDDAFVVHYHETWLTPVWRALPTELTISNYPNPFNPATTVRYVVPTEGLVNVAVYSVSGERVATLVNNRHHVAGPHEVQWHGLSDSGEPVASGVYFAQVEHAGVKQTARLVMLK